MLDDARGLPERVGFSFRARSGCESSSRQGKRDFAESKVCPSRPRPGAGRVAKIMCASSLQGKCNNCDQYEHHHPLPYHNWQQDKTCRIGDECQDADALMVGAGGDSIQSARGRSSSVKKKRAKKNRKTQSNSDKHHIQCVLKYGLDMKHRSRGARKSGVETWARSPTGRGAPGNRLESNRELPHEPRCGKVGQVWQSPTICFLHYANNGQTCSNSNHLWHTSAETTNFGQACPNSGQCVPRAREVLRVCCRSVPHSGPPSRSTNFLTPRHTQPISDSPPQMPPHGAVQGYFLFTLWAHAATSTASRPPIKCFTSATASCDKALIVVMPMASWPSLSHAKITAG